MKSKRNRVFTRRLLALEQLQARELFSVDGLMNVGDKQFHLMPSPDPQILNAVDDGFFPVDYSGAKKITQVGISRNGVETQITGDGKSILYTLPYNPSSSDFIEFVIDDSIRKTVSITNPYANLDQFDIVAKQPAMKLSVLGNDDLVGMTGKITRVLDLKAGDSAVISADGRSIHFSSSTAEFGFRSIRYVVDDLLEGTIQIAVHSAVVDDYKDVVTNSRDVPILVLSNDQYVDTFPPGTYNVHRIVSKVTSVTSSSKGGSVRIADDGLSVFYSAPANYEGADSFEYIADGKFTSKVQVNVVKPVFDDYFNVLADQSKVVLNVLANDYPGGGDGTEPRIITSLTQAKHGQVRIASDGSNIEYSPEPGYTGTDRFEYNLGGKIGSVVIYVVPLVADDYFSLSNNGLQELNVLQNDGGKWYGTPLANEINLKITSVTDSKTGAQVRISSDGTKILYSGGRGPDTLTYTVNNKYTATVSVYFQSWLTYDYYRVEENSDERNLPVLSNDFWTRYVDDAYREYQGQRKITGVTLLNSNSKVRISEDGNSIFYQPAKDFYGAETIQYEVDGYLIQDITVNVIRYTRDDSYRIAPNAEPSALPVLLNDSLNAISPAGTRITSVSQSEAGSLVSVSSDGQFINYAPAKGFVGTDRFTYYVNETQSATVEVKVQPADHSSLDRFATMAEFRQWMLNGAIQSYQSQFGRIVPDYFGRGGSDFMMLASSETNVQVAGVDEADLIENDGKHLYLMRNHELVIAEAFPTESMKVLSKVAIPGSAVGIYLNGTRLSVVSRQSLSWPIWDNRLKIAGNDWNYWNYGSTYVSVFDVTDPEDPALVQRTKIDGTAYTDSRRVENELYMVMTSPSLSLPEPLILTDEDGTKRYEDQETYVKRITESFGSIIQDALPHYATYDGEGNLVRSGILVQPEDVYQPRHSQDRQLMSILRINMASSSPGVDQALGVITGSNSKIYANTENLYVFNVNYSSESTLIRKFSWNNHQVSFDALGTVPGALASQFSADERAGVLRLATSTSIPSTLSPDSWITENAVYILKQDGDLLEIIGSTQNLPAQSWIRGVRFSEDRAIVSTQSPTDNPIIVDLSQPEAPIVLGSVPITGFDDYLQFIDDGLLLSVGKNSSGGATSVMVTLYDAKNLQQLKILGQYALRVPADSIASFDHHAFGWFKELGLLTLPIRRNVETREDSDRDGYKDAIVNRTHIELVALKIDATAGRDGSVKLASSYETDSEIIRSAFIGNVLYAFTADSLIAIGTSDFNKLAQVDLGEQSAYQDDSTDWLTVVELQKKVCDMFALQLGVGKDQIHPVSIEPVPGSLSNEFSIVTRYGDSLQLFKTSGGEITSSQADFEFGSSTWQNLDQPLDINGDQLVTPVDALLVINYLNQYGPHQLGSNQPIRSIHSTATNPPIDSTGDGYVAATDALMIINHLNAIRSAASAEMAEDLDAKRRSKIASSVS